jgi:hypothetical protein
MSDTRVIYNNGFGGLHLILALITSMIGHAIHGSLGWSIVNFLFYPIAILKWIICRELTMSVIRDAFSWFFN